LGIPNRLGRWIVLMVWTLGLAAPVQADRCGVGAILNQPAHPLAGAVVSSAANSLQSTHFIVYWGNTYSTTDPDWANATTVTAATGSYIGSPKMVGQTLTIAEQAYNKEILTLGFTFPAGLSVGGRIPIYLLDSGAVDPGGRTTMGANVLGVTGIGQNPIYISVSGDFSGTHSADPVDGATGFNKYLELTLAHEFFHTIQAGYIGFSQFDVGSSWWMEATATWMEDQVFPSSNDYLNFVSDVILYPQQALATFNGLHEYGAAIFIHRLAARFDNTTGSTVKQVFTSWQSQPGSTWEAVVEPIMNLHGATLPDAVADFWFSMLQPAAATPAYRDGALMGSLSPIGLSNGGSINLCGPDRFGVTIAAYTGLGAAGLAGSGGSGRWYGYVPGQPLIAPSPNGSGTTLNWNSATGYLLGLGLATDISSRTGGYDGTLYNEKSGPCLGFAAGANPQPPATLCTATCGVATNNSGGGSTVTTHPNGGCLIHLLGGF